LSGRAILSKAAILWMMPNDRNSPIDLPLASFAAIMKSLLLRGIAPYRTFRTIVEVGLSRSTIEMP
jgi:hypothetical protein